MKPSTLSTLPACWQREVKNLRAENAHFRRGRNEARAEVGRYRITVACLRAEVEALKAELGR